MAEFRYTESPTGLALLVALAGVAVMIGGAFTGWIWTFMLLGMAIVFGGIWGLGKAGLNLEHTYRADASGLTYVLMQKGQVKKNLVVPWASVTGIGLRKMKSIHYADIGVQGSRDLTFADSTDANGFVAFVQALQEYLPHLNYAWVHQGYQWQRVQKG